MFSPADILTIPLADWVNSFVREFLVPNFRPFFRSLQWPISQVLNGLDALLTDTDAPPSLSAPWYASAA